MSLRQISKIGLPELQERMRFLRSPEFNVRMSKNLAEEARTQVSNGFQQQRDPYGKAWQPLSRRSGMILQDTGRMAAAVATQATASGFRIDIPVAYAAAHQYGVASHARAGRAAPLSRRGQFISRAHAGNIKARRQRLTFVRGFQHGGIPRRQMIPVTSTGGLGPIWTAAFNRAAGNVIDAAAKGVTA